MKYSYFIVFLTLFCLNAHASTETQGTATNCLLKINELLQSMKLTDDIVNGHLENPTVKFEQGKKYNDSKQKVFEILNDCVRNSEKTKEVLKDMQYAAINPITTEALQKINNNLWWESFNYYAKWTTGVIATVVIGGMVLNSKKR